jgi:pimeloyl-ACP methyl ester carboxylesterase
MKALLHKNSLLLLLLILMTACSGGDNGSVATFSLTVSIDGQGTGMVTSSPVGINCGTDCSESYAENTIVTLTASRATGSSFAGWGGSCTGSDICSITMDAAKSVTATFIEYSVDCTAYAAYAPITTPVITPSSAAPATTTMIVMHGKAGTPLYLSPLYTELAINGYDVIAPYMPWSDLDWDGSMCEAMNYIDILAAQEALKGNAVIVAGHSMGGAHALIYAATDPAIEVKGIIALAPGHFPQLEGSVQILIPEIADSIALAEDMVANGNGDVSNTFYTLIPDPDNPLLQISATANDYLSYHALDQYPDINDVLPTIKLPVLWLAGTDDQLTTFYNMAALFNRITSLNSRYEVVTGDHLGMVSNSATYIDDWLFSLGL